MLLYIFIDNFKFSACDCNSYGSFHSSCSPIGKCNCKPNVNGTKCDVCDDTYYNLQSGNGCILCNCNTLGSINETCHIQTGQCPCKPGYTGTRCDQCKDGHFGDPVASLGSVQPCQKCNCSSNIDLNAIGNCDTLTGECFKCKNFTNGFNCETCESGYYGDAVSGDHPKCQTCICNTNGTNKCDNYNGECSCKPNVTGIDCGTCKYGHFDLDSKQVIYI